MHRLPVGLWLREDPKAPDQQIVIHALTVVEPGEIWDLSMQSGERDPAVFVSWAKEILKATE